MAVLKFAADKGGRCLDINTALFRTDGRYIIMFLVEMRVKKLTRGDGIGRILMVEFQDEDSAAFNEVMTVLKRYPNFENIDLNEETVISLPRLTIYPEKRKNLHILRYITSIHSI